MGAGLRVNRVEDDARACCRAVVVYVSGNGSMKGMRSKRGRGWWGDQCGLDGHAVEPHVADASATQSGR